MKNYEALKRQSAINEEKVGKKELDLQELSNREQVCTSNNSFKGSIPATNTPIVLDEDAQQFDAKNDQIGAATRKEA